MPATIETETWLCIDCDGNYESGNDAETARARYEENVGELSTVDGFRTVKVCLTVPLPTVAELAGTVPAEESPGVVRMV